MPVKAHVILLGCLVGLALGCGRREDDDVVDEPDATDEPDECATWGSTREPYRDEWREELVVAAAEVQHLDVGGTMFRDNFANRGDIEVRYEQGSSEIRVELQRFTIAKCVEDAERAFDHMSLRWACGAADGGFVLGRPGFVLSRSA